MMKFCRISNLFIKWLANELDFIQFWTPVEIFPPLLSHTKFANPTSKLQESEQQIIFQNPDYYFNFSAMYLHFHPSIDWIRSKHSHINISYNFIISLSLLLFMAYPCKFSLILYTYVCVLCKWLAFIFTFLSQTLSYWTKCMICYV